MYNIFYNLQTFCCIPSFPNNQMLPVITQEYHYSEYWPPVIYEQGLLPYSATDTKGILYELIIE